MSEPQNRPEAATGGNEADRDNDEVENIPWVFEEIERAGGVGDELERDIANRKLAGQVSRAFLREYGGPQELVGGSRCQQGVRQKR